MTDETTYPEHEEDDLLAAEYVLGVLTQGQRTDVAARLKTDREFAALVSDWQGRLAPLNDDYIAVAPPATSFDKIARRLFADAAHLNWLQKFWASTGLWRGIAVASIAVLAVSSVLYLRAPQDSGPNLVSTIAAQNSDVAFLALYDPTQASLRIRQTTGAVAALDKSFELWVILPEQQPVSLGVITQNQTDYVLTGQHASLIRAGATLAVTLEQNGGSPTGAPLGPLVAVGTIQEI